MGLTVIRSATKPSPTSAQRLALRPRWPTTSWSRTAVDDVAAEPPRVVADRRKPGSHRRSHTVAKVPSLGNGPTADTASGDATGGAPFAAVTGQKNPESGATRADSGPVGVSAIM